jgi:tetratricopeptide (TPR) repeat protein
MLNLLEDASDYLLKGDHPLELIKLFAALLTAYFTVTWSLKRFLKEKKWEKKFEAYSHIMEALHHLKRAQLLYLHDELQQHKFDEGKLAEVNFRYQQAKNELEKYIDIGRYYIIEEAIAALEKLYKVYEECIDAWNNGDPMLVDLYERELEAVEDCLGTIRRIAIKDVHK